MKFEHSPASPLGRISRQTFLKKYWQKKPLLIRQAWKGLELDLDFRQLALLAQKKKVVSRLVQGEKKSWKVADGPFQKSDFASLPSSRWTLLVQETEKWVEEMRELKDFFRFLPDWRMDDVMVSFAAPQGSVGPHLDEYDVFLLQGQGTRRWMIESSPRPHSQEDFYPHLDLKILRTFQPTQEFLLSPGDMLYLPPRVPHHGVAVDECITVSVGLRSPSVMELMSYHLGPCLDALTDSQRYEDKDLSLPLHPAEITPNVLAKVHDLIKTHLLNEDGIPHWLGKLVTAAKREESGSRRPSRKNVVPSSLKGMALKKDAGSRMCFIRKKKGGTWFFVDGEEYETPKTWDQPLEILTLNFGLSSGEITRFRRLPGFYPFLEIFIRKGVLYWEKNK